ncbi:hypothetical protein SAMN05421637_1737 [Demequina mangrovi]|uniref:Uncharacterized protein n=1 Tax=Demequina mangrovi TaxID=1043493 RepID=A0A1H6YJC3_9MICO|nr:hypothetical protein SAMN05421637_1737 [Demequina mangrovi]
MFGANAVQVGTAFRPQSKTVDYGQYTDDGSAHVLPASLRPSLRRGISLDAFDRLLLSRKT